MVVDVDAVEQDPPGVDVVEAHQQVDQRGLAGTCRADDRARSRPGSTSRLKSSISGLSGTYRNETSSKTTRPSTSPGRTGSSGSGDLLLGSSRNSKTRSAEATPDCRRLTTRGDLGDRHRELPRVLDEGLDVAEGHRPGGHPQAADHGDGDVVEVRDEHHRRLDDAGDELRLEAGLVHALVGSSNSSIASRRVAEHLHQVVAGVHLLDVAVERPGPLPLRRRTASASAWRSASSRRRTAAP